MQRRATAGLGCRRRHLDSNATAAQNASGLAHTCSQGWIVLGHDAGRTAGDFVVNALPPLIDAWRSAGDWWHVGSGVSDLLVTLTACDLQRRCGTRST